MAVTRQPTVSPALALGTTAFADPGGGRGGRAAVRTAQRVVAGVALGVALAVVIWLAAAAAQRPSVLSPPTLRGGGRWLLGPLSGLLPHLSRDPGRLHDDLAIALVVLLLAWVAAWMSAGALPLRVVLGVTGLAQAVMVLGPPQPLTDAFNYVVYGRMAAHGLNPYRVLPVAGPHDGAYVLANWHHLPSPYGPLFTLLCEPLGLMSAPAAMWAWKAIVLLCALAVLALVAWLARRLSVSPQRAVACVGLCPVTLAYGVGGLHNDLPAIVCVLAAVACVVRARDDGRPGPGWDAGAGALVVAAAALKPSFAVAVPLVLLGAGRRGAAAAGAAAAAAVVGGIVLVAFGGALPAIGLQARLVTPASVPNIAGALLGHGGADQGVRDAGRDGLVLVVVLACAAVARRREHLPAALGVVLLAAVLSLPWVMPWYLAWSLPLVALARPRALAVPAVLACVWLGVGGSPQIPQVLHRFGYYPTRNPTGMANHELERRLVR